MTAPPDTLPVRYRLDLDQGELAYLTLQMDSIGHLLSASKAETPTQATWAVNQIVLAAAKVGDGNHADILHRMYQLSGIGR